MAYINGKKVLTVNGTIYMGENLNVDATPQTDTSAHILAFTENKGIYVGTDTGHWYGWDGTQYVDGGVYQATAIADDSVLLSQLAPETIKAFGFSQINPTFEVGSINSSTGVIETNNVYYIHSDLITIKNLFYIKLLEDLAPSTNFHIMIFKYDKNGNFLGYDSDVISIEDIDYNKIKNYDDINIRLRINFESPRDFTNQTYFDYVVNRLAFYLNNIYSCDYLDNKLNELNDDINNIKYIFDRPKFYSKNSDYVPANRYDYNTVLQSRIDINISRNGHKWGTDFNIKQKMISTENGVTVYMSTNGNDTNDGLTPSTPKLTLQGCLSVTNVDTIIVESGVYYSGLNFTTGLTINQSVNIICSKYAYFVNGYKYTNVTDLGNNYYRITYANGQPRFLIDLKTMINLTDVNSATDMPYYSIYKGYSGCIVRLPYKPNANNLILTQNIDPIMFSAKCYVEGIGFIGGTQSIKVYLGQIDIYFSHCQFMYSRNNGFNANGGNCYLYKCEASYNYLDGFNYHSNEYIPCSLEIECCAYNNGYLNVDNTSISNNGSTIHDNGKAIRLNCDYSYSKGGVIADHTAKSFNFGCTSSNSTCYVSGYETNNTSIHCINNCTMYLFDCVLYGSKYEISMVQGNGTINTNIEYNKIYQEDSTETINIIQ